MKRQEVQKEKHKRQKETHHSRRINGDEEFVNVCQEPINEIKLVAKDLQGSKIVRFPAFARAN